MPERFNLADYLLFDRIRDGLAERTALRFGDRQWSYGDVADRARRVSGLLQAQGVRLGERVYIVLPDMPPFAWVFFGALRAGAVVTMGNPLSPADALLDVVEYVRARVLFTTPSVAARLSGRLPDNVTVLLAPDAATFDDPEAPLDDPRCLWTALSAADPTLVPPSVQRDDAAIWLFTSGSTGRPKAAMHCHGDFAYNTEVYAKGTIGYRADDVCVSVPRLFFGYATGTNLMFPFAVGACAALFSEKPTAQRIAWAVDHYRATALTNVPTLMARILEADAEAPLSFESLRFSLSAGEALPPALLARWQSRFDAPVYDGIGSAEMFHIYLSNRPDDIKPGSLGRPVDGYVLKILPADAEGPGAPEVAVGETGVLWVKGDSVALGYWLDRKKSWRTFHGHWCRSGDLFSRDADGYFWFKGRADALLKIAGQWVSPLEVEHCLCRHPAVKEAAVIGVQREGLMLSRAVVAVRDPVTAEALQRFVQTALAKYKYPREVVFVDALPRNDRGKIDRKALPR